MNRRYHECPTGSTLVLALDDLEVCPVHIDDGRPSLGAIEVVPPGVWFPLRS
jgi:hypothetical protein